jgi:Peptidyl-prolyl cis-trans isomerase (rotamase) - cyclophilin family
MAVDPDVANEQNPLITLETTRGDITLELFEQRAPQTVENFLGLATGEKEWSDPDTGETRTDSLYEGTIFHRIIPEFMIQGGDPEGTGRGGPGYTFDDEFHEDLNHDGAGILSMANRGPNTMVRSFLSHLTHNRISTVNMQSSDMSLREWIQLKILRLSQLIAMINRCKILKSRLSILSDSPIVICA